MRFTFLLTLIAALLNPLWANPEAGAGLVNLLKNQSRLKYVTSSADIVQLNCPENIRHESLSSDGFSITFVEGSPMSNAALSVNQDGNLVVTSNGIDLNFEFIGSSSQVKEASFLSYDFLKDALTGTYTEESLSKLSADEVKELLPSIITKANLLDGFSDYIVFEGKHARGYACHRLSDNHVYGQLWISGDVFTYFIKSKNEGNWREFTMGLFSQLRALSKATEKD